MGDHPQGLGGRKPLRQLGDVRVLPARGPGGEDQVGAPGQLDLVLLRQAVEAVRPVDDRLRLEVSLLVGKVGQAVGGERLGTEPDATVGEQLHRGFVDQVAVLDGLDARVDGPPDALDVVEVHGDVRAPVVRRLHGGAHLLRRVLPHVERVVDRRDAAAAENLDLRRSEPQVLADRRQHFVHAIGEDAVPDGLRGGNPAAESARPLVVAAIVAVAGGLGDDRARGVDAWADDGALVDRALQRERRTTDVPHRGEPAQERPLGLGACVEHEVAQVRVADVRQRVGAQDGVPVRVDQPRHEHAPTALDRRGTRRRSSVLADLRDLVAGDQDARRPAQPGALAVEDADVAEENGRRRGVRGGRARGQGQCAGRKGKGN